MGTAFIDYNFAEEDSLENSNYSEMAFEINKSVFNCIVDFMKLNGKINDELVGRLDAAIGIKYLSIDVNSEDEMEDLEFVFYDSLQKLKSLGPTDDYEYICVEQFKKQLNMLLENYILCKNKIR